MTVIDEYGRLEPPIAGDETAVLLGYLDFHRATLAWKCSGLDASGLNTTVGVSTMTLGGMLKHLALVEDGWFSFRLFANEPLPLWNSVDWDADPDWDWDSAVHDSPEELRAIWEEAVHVARERCAEALADGGLDRLADRPWPDGRRMNLRWILLHMIEEYARHNGHADLIRESIDGSSGE